MLFVKTLFMKWVINNDNTHFWETFWKLFVDFSRTLCDNFNLICRLNFTFWQFSWHQNVAKEITERMRHFPARSGHGYPQGRFYKISHSSNKYLLTFRFRALCLICQSYLNRYFSKISSWSCHQTSLNFIRLKKCLILMVSDWAFVSSHWGRGNRIFVDKICK